MIDYSIFYKEKFQYDSGWQNKLNYDVFLSAYSNAERVQKAYNLVKAVKKHWLIMPEFGYDKTELPGTECYDPGLSSSSEAEYIQGMWRTLNLDSSLDRICIDITGFIRPYLLYMVWWLKYIGVTKFDAIYSEPVIYTNRGKTKFSSELIDEVRQVSGFEGQHVVDTSNDYLILGSGYDHYFISHVADYKRSARKIQLFGLPSLQVDMYMENRLRANAAAEDVGDGSSNTAERLFAPANDPFIVANVLQSTVKRLQEKHGLTNLYLSPLATKPQALGFALYYVCECRDTATSLVFPYCNSYPKNTSSGLTNIWRYTIEFPS